jgi:hypothetical protein
MARLVLDVGHLLKAHGEQHHLLVQRLVVLQMVQQRQRQAVRAGRHEDGGARHADDAVFLDLIDEELHRQAAALHGLEEDGASVRPRLHDDPDAQADDEREPGAGHELEQAAGDVAELRDEEDDDGDARFPERPLPDLAGDEEEQQAGEGHVERHGEAVGGGEIGGGLKWKTSARQEIMRR